MRLLSLIAVATVAVCTAEPPKAPPRTIRVALSAPAQSELKQGAMKASLVGGGPARVVRFRSAKSDLLVLVVMDVVSEILRVDAARRTIVDQFQSLPKSTWAGLLRAQDGLQVLLDPTSDREKLESVLMGMPVAGNAGLLSTLETALRLADSIAAKSAVRIAVLYITDSEVGNYREDFTNPVINSSDSRDLSRRFPDGLIRERLARLTETAAAFQTPLFIAHLDYANDRLNQAYQSGLMQLAASTGGSAEFARSLADVPEVVARALSRIQAMSVAWVQLPPKPPKTVQLTLEAEGQPLQHRSQFLLK